MQSHRDAVSRPGRLSLAVARSGEWPRMPGTGAAAIRRGQAIVEAREGIGMTFLRRADATRNARPDGRGCAA